MCEWYGMSIGERSSPVTIVPIISSTSGFEMEMSLRPVVKTTEGGAYATQRTRAVGLLCIGYTDPLSLPMDIILLFSNSMLFNGFVVQG